MLDGIYTTINFIGTKIADMQTSMPSKELDYVYTDFEIILAYYCGTSTFFIQSGDMKETESSWGHFTYDITH